MDETKKSSKQIMNEMIAATYVRAAEAKKAGKPICWATGIAPQELMTAMDIATVYPENFGAAMGAKHFSGHFCEVAEAAGYVTAGPRLPVIYLTSGMKSPWRKSQGAKDLGRIRKRSTVSSGMELPAGPS